MGAYQLGGDECGKTNVKVLTGSGGGGGREAL